MPQTPQTDPYASIAQPIHQPQSADPYASIATPIQKSAAPQQPQDTRNGAQQYLDKAYAPKDETGQGWLTRQVDGFGQGAAQSILQPISHPIQAAKGLLESATPDPGWKGAAETLLSPAAPMAVHMAQGFMQDGKQNGWAHALGNAAGMVAAPEASEVLPSEIAGNAMKSAGGKMINNTVGLLKKDVARGADPGRAYLEGGGGPQWSMRGIANKADAINSKTGAQLGDAYRAADQRGVRIPAEQVLNQVAEPIANLRTLQEAPGGTGKAANIRAYEDRLLPPIAAAQDRGGFAPSELFSQMKKPISDNTKWRDQSNYDLNQVRQETTGRIGGLLSDAVPETTRLNKIYQGNHNLAERAATRADTNQSGLGTLLRRGLEGGAGASLGYFTHSPLLSVAPLVADSVPVRTAAATGLFRSGNVLPAVTKSVSVLPPASRLSAGRPKPSPQDDADR